MQVLAALEARTVIPGLVAVLLLASLAGSVVTRAGHADAPIADTAAEIQPVAEGEAAPRFEARRVDGSPFRFDPASLERPAILITFRGGWCPYCNMHLSELRHAIPEIRELGIDVYFLSGDRPDRLYASLAADTQADIDGRGYTILSDADAHAAVALGIAFRTANSTISRRYEKGDDIEGSSMARHAVLPVPAVFAIGSDGIVAFAHAEADYRKRLPAEELLAVARTLAGG